MIEDFNDPLSIMYRTSGQKEQTNLNMINILDLTDHYIHQEQHILPRYQHKRNVRIYSKSQ